MEMDKGLFIGTFGVGLGIDQLLGQLKFIDDWSPFNSLHLGN